MKHAVTTTMKGRKGNKREERYIYIYIYISGIKISRRLFFYALKIFTSAAAALKAIAGK